MGFDLGSAITGFVQGVVSPVTTLIQRKAELAAAQHQADLAAIQATGERQAELIKQGKADDAAWELESLKAGSSYRGFELYVLSTPAVLCFIPPMTKYVVAGFAALATCPSWYLGTFMMVYAANYGIRLWRRNQSDT